MKIYLSIFALLFSFLILKAQKKDTIDGKVITLAEVVVGSKMNVRGFMDRVMNDTSFYKAFRNLRILEFSCLNDIRMMDSNGDELATLSSNTRQHIFNGCRYTEKISENTSGKFYEKDGSNRFYTASLYSSLMFAYDTVCGETNIIKNKQLNIRDKSGIAKHKEQLKMLFFNPGVPIEGIPFMGKRAALFDEELSAQYDFSIDIADKNHQLCYVFTATAKRNKEGSRNPNVVIDSMVTWFDSDLMEVVSRSYTLSYSAGIYSFDVDMEVELGKFGEWLVPTLIRYNGEWKVITKKKEKGIFTATLFDFSKGEKK